jgi:hypothetical protein
VSVVTGALLVTVYLDIKATSGIRTNYNQVVLSSINRRSKAEATKLHHHM